MKIRCGLMFFLITLMFGCPVFAYPEMPVIVEYKDGGIIGKSIVELGGSGGENEKIVKRPVLLEFEHSDHGLGFGKMVWDGKKVINFRAAIHPAERFSIYPYHVRVIVYDPQNKAVRSEDANIGVTWQNYPWNGPSLFHFWNPAIDGTAIHQIPLTRLSENPFGKWTVVFYKDMNFGGDHWHWETLGKYTFEIIDGTAKAKQDTYVIDANKNCVFLNQNENIAEKAVRIPLRLNTRYMANVSGQAFFSAQTGSEADPMPGVVLFYSDNTQDGFGTLYRVIKPGESVEFTTPNEDKENVFLLAFVMDFWPASTNTGSYTLQVEQR